MLKNSVAGNTLKFITIMHRDGVSPHLRFIIEPFAANWASKSFLLAFFKMFNFQMMCKVSFGTKKSVTNLARVFMHSFFVYHPEVIT